MEEVAAWTKLTDSGHFVAEEFSFALPKHAIGGPL